MSRWTRAATAGAAVLAAAATGWASPARSEVLEHQRFADSSSRDIDLCGLSVRVDSEARGMFNIRVGKGSVDTLFFEHTVEKYADRITNPANGKYFTTSGQTVVQEMRARRVEGSVFRITSNEAGLPLVVRDMNGNVVLRDRGVITTTILFDTGGDHVPGGDVVEVLDVRVAGPHPDFFLEDAERCALIHDLIG